jgi:NTP pyrophosphatase (non-canonical NTP hydrolase)
MEEVGELATALHDNRPPHSGTNPGGKKRPISPEERANLEEEFADVLAWLMTLANITGVDFEKALAKYTVEGRVEGTKE